MPLRWKHKPTLSGQRRDRRYEDFQSSDRTETMCYHRSLLVSIQPFNGDVLTFIFSIRTHSGIWF